MRLFALTALCLVSAAALAQPSADGDSLLARQLSLRVEADQAARGLWTLAFQRGEQPSQLDGLLGVAIDSLNTAWLKTVIAETGWPTVSRVGEQGVHDAMLLVQHADMDRAFQRDVLALMEAGPDRETLGMELAYLTDRVRVHQGAPQVYGTQLNVVGGRPEPFAIEDPDGVDARRAAVGLEPLADYIESFRRDVLGGAPADEADEDQTP